MSIVPGGVPPDGYRFVEGRLQVDPDRAKVVQKIFALMIEERSVARVRDLLNAEGTMKISCDRAYPPHGILRCGHHGDTMTPHWVVNRHGKKVPYYRCVHTFKRGKGAFRGCSVRQVNADKIEKLIFNELFRLAGNSDLVAGTLDVLNEEIGQKASPLQAELDQLKDRETMLNRQIENSLDLITVVGDKSEQSRKRLLKLEAELAILRGGIEDKQREARAVVTESYDLGQVAAALQDFELMLKAATGREKEQLCRNLLPRVTFHGEGRDIELEIFNLKEKTPGVRNLGGVKRKRRDSNPQRRVTPPVFETGSSSSRIASKDTNGGE